MKKLLKKIAGAVAVIAVGACVTACDCGDYTRTITFNYGSDNVKIVQVDNNEKVDRPDNPTRTGYEFAGWFSDENYTQEFDFSKSITQNTTIYAKWVKIANISKPTTSLLSDGYVVNIDNDATTILDGETLKFKVLIAKDYIRDSNIVVKINNIEQSLDNIEHDVNVDRYSFEYLCTGEDINIMVEGVEIEKYNITLPNVTGVRVVSYIGYNNENIEKYKDYKFTLEFDEGYDETQVLVSINGVRVQAVDGVYSVSNIVDNNTKIEISNVVLKEYAVEYYKDNEKIEVFSNETFTINNYSLSCQYHKQFGFDFILKDIKYSQIGANIKNYIDIYILDEKVDYSITQNGNTYAISILQGVINGFVKVVIRTQDFPLNIYSLNLNSYTQASDGYTIEFTKYEDSIGEHVIDNTTGVVNVPHGSKIYLRATIDSGISTPNNLLLVAIGDKTGQFGKSFTSGNEISFEVIEDMSFKLSGDYTMTFDRLDGVQMLGMNGYTNKSYISDISGYNARQFQFKVNVNEVAYNKLESYKVVYYVDDIDNAVEITSDDNLYTINNISSNLHIAVLGVEMKKFDIDLSGTVEGLDNISFADNSTSASNVTYFSQTEFTVTISDSHSDSVGTFDIKSNKAEINKVTTNGNVVTFRITNLIDNMTIEDLTIYNLSINRYTITLPDINSRTTYSLYLNGDKILDNSLSINHGQDININIVPNAEYTKDTNYIIKINNADISHAGDFVINLVNVTEDLLIELTGIDEINTYSISYYKPDGTLISTTNNVTHGFELTNLEDFTDLDNHYEFAGWYLAENNNGNIVATDTKVETTIVDKDLDIIAVETPINYVISYRFTDNPDETLDDLPETIDNSNNTNNDQGQLVFNIETLQNDIIILDTSGLILEGYTFDYFSLAEDINVLGTIITAGTKVSMITENLLSNMTLVANWKITVGTGTNSNYSTLADAIDNASTTRVDKIEVTGNISEEGYVYINKSVNIVGVGYNATVARNGFVQMYNSAYNFVLINGTTRNITVNISNLKFEFTYNNNSYPLNTIYAKNCNLNLDKVSIVSSSNGLVFEGNKQLNISNSCVFNLTNNNMAQTSEYAIKLIPTENTLTANISNTIMYDNVATNGFKGVYLTNNNNNLTPEISINSVVFTSENKNEDSNISYAIYVDSDCYLNTSSLNINNDEYLAWSYGLYVNKYIDLSSSSLEDKSIILDNLDSKVNELKNDNIKSCIIYCQRFLDYAEYFEINKILDSEGNTSSEMRFGNSTQLKDYLSKGYAMTFVGKSDVELTGSIVVLDSQSIDFNGANVTISDSTNAGEYGTIINNGTIVSINKLNVSQLINTSSISSNIIVISRSLNNTGLIRAESMQIQSTATAETNDEIDATNLSNAGNLTVNGIIYVYNELNNSGVITFGENIDEPTDVPNFLVYTLENSGTVNVGDSLRVMYMLDNTANGTINILQYGKLDFNSTNSNNDGVINNSGQIVDNSTNSIRLKTINDYGLNDNQLSYYITGEDGVLHVSGILYPANNNAIVHSLYTDGSGYYIGLRTSLGYANANKQYNIEFTRNDKEDMTYASIPIKTDITDNLGRLEMIVDANVAGTTMGLTGLTIRVYDETDTFEFTIDFAEVTIKPILVGQTINDYGLNNEQLTYTSTKSSNISTISGVISQANDGSVAESLYPTGSGYYVGLTLFLGKRYANSEIVIQFERNEKAYMEYDYVTKTTTDIADEYGRLEILVDVNVIEGIIGLSSINIYTKVLNGENLETVMSKIQLNFDNLSIG